MANEAHVRIDEGIKRGPKKQRIALKRPTKPVALSPIIPTTLDPREVLERYLAEPKTSQIAESYGVTRANLVRWLRQVCPDEWKQVQIVRALVYKEDGNEGLDAAENALLLARAREMVKSAQWELERLDHQNYGVKQEVSITADIRVQVDHALSESALELAKRIRSVASQPTGVQVQQLEDQSK